MAQLNSTKRMTLLAHLLFWLVLFVFPFLLHPDLLADTRAARINLSFYVVRFAAWVMLFYLNAYVLIPLLFYPKKYLAYFLTQLLVIAALTGLHFLMVALLLHHFHLHAAPLSFTVFPYLFVWACSTAYQMLRNKTITDRILQEKEKENLKTELAFLRSQVSPHFLFNVMNNMVSLARKKSEQLEPSLVKLSSLLRYMLYDADEEKNMLSQEIEYLQSYIDLQVQRFGKNLLITANMQKHDISYCIEPMLLIPFVENAFKHGVIEHNAQIDIDLTAKNGELHFFVRNRYDDMRGETKDKTSGIGLNNVKRRLELLYAGQHQLQVEKSGGWFTMALQLKLQPC